MTYISIPFSVALTDESSWRTLDERRTSFAVVRFHFRLNDRILESRSHAVGDAIGIYQKPRGMTTKHVKSDTISIEQVVATKSIENHLVQNEVLSEIASELLGTDGVAALLGVKIGVKSKIAHKLSTTFSVGTEIATSEKVTRTETLTVENTIPAEIDETIVSVPVYKRRIVDISLAYIDYLEVDYRRSRLGLRKKAKRYPVVEDFQNHPNRIPLGLPVATAYYWQLLAHSSKFIYEREHNVEVSDPLQIMVCEPRSSSQTHFTYRKDIPTLYKIARAAFPTKWILRKSIKQDWTEEQLNAIEHEEVDLLDRWR